MISKDEVIELAKECDPEYMNDFGDLPDALLGITIIQRFANACYKRGIEDAAKVCDMEWKGDADTYDTADACNEYAEAIRKLRETE